MKKIVLTTVLTFIAQISFGQLTLEHTFPGGVNVIKINVTDYRYVTIDTTNNLVSIYNTDYSIDKNISIQRPVGTYYAANAFVSKNLFNSNNTYQAGITMVTKNHNSVSGYYYYIFDEDGSVLWKSPNGYYYAAYYNTSAGSKMVLTSLQSDTQQVYSLVGHYYASSIKPIGGDSISTQAYPNPSSDHLIIPVLKLKMATDIVISDMQGKIVQQVTVNQGQNSVDIDTRSLPDGAYVYFIGPQGSPVGETGKFMVSH